MNRRDFIASGVCGLAMPALVGAGRTLPDRTSLEYEDELIDRLWMYGHDSGEHDGPGGQYKIPLSAPISVGDATREFGIRNVTMCRWGHATDEYLEQFKGLKRVKWAICGSRNKFYRNLLEHNFKLIDKLPNLCGFELDDYFRSGPTCEVVETGRGLEYTANASFSYHELLRLRERARRSPRRLDLHLVLYNYQTTRAIGPTLDAVDSVHFWVWRAKDIPYIREDFASFRRRAPDIPAFLGIYMWDFGDKKPLPVELMKAQLDTGLELFREGEIEGMVFHCSPLVNKNLEAVDYARRWIGEHAHEVRRDKAPVRRKPASPSSAADAPMASFLADVRAKGECQGAVSVLSNAEDALTVTACGAVDGEPVTAETPFAVGMLGSTVAGAALAKGIELGYLNLKDPVAGFLPEFEGLPFQFTVAQAQLQTAGFAASSASKPAVSLRESVRLLADPALFSSKPGQRFVPSAFSVDVACACIEVASGLDFETFVRRYLFKPLGMNNTTFGKLPFVSGIVSTPRDFIRLLQFHAHHGSLLGKTVVARKVYDDLVAEPMSEKSCEVLRSLCGSIVRGRWMVGDTLWEDGGSGRIFEVNMRFTYSRLLVLWRPSGSLREDDLAAGWRKAANALQRGREAHDALE